MLDDQQTVIEPATATAGLTPTPAATTPLPATNSNPYSGANVLAAATEPVTYDYSDPYGARTAIGTRLGLGEATTAEQAAAEALTGFQDTTRAQINALRNNRDLSVGLEQGFEATRLREASEQESILTNQLTNAQNARIALENKVNQEWSVFQQEQAKREDLYTTALQYGAKNVNINDSIENLTKAASEAKSKYEKDQKKEQEKDDLKKEARSLGINTKGKSGKELAKAIAKYYKKEGIKKDSVDAIDMALKNKELAKPYYKEDSEKEISIDKSDKGISGLIEEAVNSGDSWGDIAAVLTGAGISTTAGSIADKYLRHKFLGEENPIQ